MIDPVARHVALFNEGVRTGDLVTHDDLPDRAALEALFSGET